MRFSIVAATLAAALTTSASPLTIRAESDYKWSVEKWEAGCSRGGCYYWMNVTGEAKESYPKAPAFFVACRGYNEGADYADCTFLDDGPAGRRVASKLLHVNVDPYVPVDPVISVSYQFADATQPRTYWNFTGKAQTKYNQFVSPPMSFEIVPDTAFGVGGN